jgi:hypothetical protein
MSRRDHLRRLADTKQQPKATNCRAWIAIVNNRWHWSNPSDHPAHCETRQPTNLAPH